MSASPVAALAREPVPDRKGDRQKLTRRERGARVGAKWPLEDDRPFPLVVARDARDIPRVVRRDVRASPAGELKGLFTRQIEEPEIDRALRVAKNEVRLAGAGRYRRRNLDRDGVVELGWRSFRGRRLRKRIRGCGGRAAAPGAAAGFAASSSIGTGSIRPAVPVLSALMSCHRTRNAIDSSS